MRMKKFIAFILCLLISFSSTIPPIVAVENSISTEQKKKKKNSSRRKTKSKTKNKKKETSTDVKKRQQKTEREIKLTQEQIAENERKIKRNLTELDKLNNNIILTQNKVDSISILLQQLDTQITTLSNSIESHEKKLKKLRDDYISAVKKMRIANKKSSPLAFIFSAGSFYQAFRRMRYIQKFSEWRERQASSIKHHIEEIRKEQLQLNESKESQAEALAKHLEIRNSLKSEYGKQDKVLKELKDNGESLKSHLAKKQAEADNLNNRIIQLIAEEEERRRKEEEAAVAKARQEEKARQEAERKRIEAEEAKRQSEEKKQEETKSKSNDNKVENPAEKGKPVDNKKVKEKTKESDNSYAKARGRRPRNKGVNTENATTSSFASAKGLLPHPVAGSFRIERPFGKHPLPGLSDVMYDNPGIDAVVDAGSSAQAVYDGTVSAIYVLKEYSTVIIVSHGGYYTVYGHIATPLVKSGDKVKQGQSIGTLVSDPEQDNKTMIHFEIWEKRTKRNPVDWLK